MNWLALQSTHQVVIPIPFIIIALVILGLAGLGLLWQRGKKLEAISLLNTMLLIIIIILLLVPLPR